MQGQLNAPGTLAPAPVVAAYQAGLARVRQSSRPLPEVQGLTLDEKTERRENQPGQPQPVATVALAGFIILFALGLLTGGAGRSRPQLPRPSRP